jgi:hypothetical protein
MQGKESASFIKIMLIFWWRKRERQLRGENPCCQMRWKAIGWRGVDLDWPQPFIAPERVNRCSRPVIYLLSSLDTLYGEFIGTSLFPLRHG